MAMENASATVSRAPKRGKKYFTLDEANRSLVYVSRIVEDIAACYKQAVDIRQRIENPAPTPGPSQSQDHLQAEYDQSMDHLGDLMDELHQVGVELKDFEMGLLDFPAVHEGREVYLCWHRGEPTVATWHEVDAGYAGRQDVALLSTN